jgi:hypothetical protein
MRKIVLPSGTWQYNVSYTFVVLYSPSGVKDVVDIATLTRRSWDTIERGRWKGTPDGSVLPSDIRRYLEHTEIARSR